MEVSAEYSDSNFHNSS